MDCIWIVLGNCFSFCTNQFCFSLIQIVGSNKMKRLLNDKNINTHLLGSWPELDHLTTPAGHLVWERWAVGSTNQR